MCDCAPSQWMDGCVLGVGWVMSGLYFFLAFLPPSLPPSLSVCLSVCVADSRRFLSCLVLSS